MKKSKHAINSAGIRVCQIYEKPITKEKPEGMAVLWVRDFAADPMDGSFQRWKCSFYDEKGVIEVQQVIRTLDSKDITTVKTLTEHNGLKIGSI